MDEEIFNKFIEEYEVNFELSKKMALAQQYKKKEIQHKYKNYNDEEQTIRFTVSFQPLAEFLDIINDSQEIETQLTTIGFQIKLDKINEKEEKKKGTLVTITENDSKV